MQCRILAPHGSAYLKKIKSFRYIYYSLIVLLIFSCTPNNELGDTKKDNSIASQNETISIILEAENFVDSSGTVTIESMDADGKYISTQSDEAWVSFEVNIPEAGRYKLELNGASKGNASAWMEDYIDNKDDRTYNITGSVPINNSDNNSFSISSKDGSPLNKGVHKMKLHLKGGAQVDWVKFSLMKKHQLTPQTMTQKTDGKEWKVVWSDEFDGEGLPDTSKWIYDVGDWGWGNNELQYYTENRLENARQENGNLIIQARKNDMAVLCQKRNKPWCQTRQGSGQNVGENQIVRRSALHRGACRPAC